MWLAQGHAVKGRGRSLDPVLPGSHPPPLARPTHAEGHTLPSLPHVLTVSPEISLGSGSFLGHAERWGGGVLYPFVKCVSDLISSLLP